MPGTIDSLRPRARARLTLIAVAATALLACPAASAGAAPIPTQVIHSSGEIVPIPDLRWIAARYPIYVTDGYSGPLPDGEHVGCDNCHVRDSDHYNGLAVDVVPLGGSGRCDASWAPITRLAHWAEPVQNHPRPPFRWVGYDGDAGHGCGNHLHLSWEHASAPMFQLAEWVEVFPASSRAAAPQQPPPSGAPAGVNPPKGPRGGSAPSPSYERGPRGGVSAVQAGGVSPHGD